MKKDYNERIVGIVAHRVPQLSLEVITKNITWEEALQKDWRKIGGFNIWIRL